MFVLPPPPRYPSSTNAYGAATSGAPAPVIETSNTIKHPTGPDYQFSVGEGTYVLKEDLHLATPPPHPSEAPVTNPNPLSTAVHPIIAGTKLSLVQSKDQRIHSLLYRHPTVSSSRDTHDESVETDEDSSIGRGTGSGSLGSKSGDPIKPAPEKFGNGNAMLNTSSGKNVKKKPKSNMAKSNSSFVSRIIPHEHLEKRLRERRQEDMMLFANINRAFCWLDMESPIKHEPLSKILFTRAHPLCHDVNVLTRSASNIDVIIGFSTGDIIWFDPVTTKYARINKNGAINASAVTEIRWLPGSETLFLAAHNDGSLIVYDREKEDAPFMPEDAPSSTTYIPGTSPMGYFGIRKSVHSLNQKSNPVSYWSVSKGPITAFSFSPDSEHLAVVSEDECLRVINFVKEKLLDVYPSYYGGFTCVCWSPDSRYIVTGGQDDLVSIFSFPERRIIARCEGHHSWVSSVAFDPWRCDDRTYRFGSVGNDCRLLLWDFSEGMLHKPKVVSHQHRSSISRAPTGENASLRVLSNPTLDQVMLGMEEMVVHNVDGRLGTSILPPVMSKIIDPCPLSQVVFLETGIITTCVDGHIRTWNRPAVDGAVPITAEAVSS